MADAALSVGRDPAAWLAAVPALASSEIIARRSPLAADLGQRTLDHGSCPRRLKTDPVSPQRFRTALAGQAAHLRTVIAVAPREAKVFALFLSR